MGYCLNSTCDMRASKNQYGTWPFKDRQHVQACSTYSYPGKRVSILDLSLKPIRPGFSFVLRRNQAQRKWKLSSKKTILSWSNGMTFLNRKYMVFPLKDHFIIENGLLD